METRNQVRVDSPLAWAALKALRGPATDALRAAFARFAWCTLALTVGVIAWGAYVRATGSGAGCGSHWPTCNGEVVPRSPAAATVIEYAHRASSGLALVLVLALAVAALAVFERGAPARRAALASLGFMVTEAGIGAAVVLLKYVDQDRSVARAVWVAVHLGNTFLLVAALALTAWWGRGGGGLRLRGRGALAWPLGVSLGALLLVGAAGAVTALGDTLFPAASLAEGVRGDLSPSAHFLVRLRVWHPLLALGAAGLVLWAALRVAERCPRGPVLALRAALLWLLGVQLGGGLLNLVLLAPTWMQLVHLLLADALWVALVLFAAAALAPEAGGPAPGPGAAGGRGAARPT
ncbi:MAG TPA: COX15/CtaA family protein [Polyangiaceae bacterium]|nr:COX15/CtaA family protein [Polyangiaceae bacterium]